MFGDIKHTPRLPDLDKDGEHLEKLWKNLDTFKADEFMKIADDLDNKWKDQGYNLIHRRPVRKFMLYIRWLIGSIAIYDELESDKSYIFYDSQDGTFGVGSQSYRNGLSGSPIPNPLYTNVVERAMLARGIKFIYCEELMYICEKKVGSKEGGVFFSLTDIKSITGNVIGSPHKDATTKIPNILDSGITSFDAKNIRSMDFNDIVNITNASRVFEERQDGLYFKASFKTKRFTILTK